MKLLLDENLSPRLADLLLDLYPVVSHVENCGLGAASDDAVWEYAKAHECTIISKDSDFAERAVLFGYPPKVIWIGTGNCSTSEIEQLLRAAQERIRKFIESDEESCLLLGRRRPRT